MAEDIKTTLLSDYMIEQITGSNFSTASIARYPFHIESTQLEWFEYGVGMNGSSRWYSAYNGDFLLTVIPQGQYGWVGFMRVWEYEEGNEGGFEVLNTRDKPMADPSMAITQLENRAIEYFKGVMNKLMPKSLAED